ncbi:MAG: hypothetical protein IPH77_16940 [Ignavibacteria bacterium]|nr:hypothetical protein [Ignavibacteria bacterium]
MISSKNKGSDKTAKGYRLKNSTHSLIEKIQLMTDGSKDTVISRALNLYYNEIIKAGNMCVQNILIKKK